MNKRLFFMSALALGALFFYSQATSQDSLTVAESPHQVWIPAKARPVSKDTHSGTKEAHAATTEAYSGTEAAHAVTKEAHPDTVAREPIPLGEVEVTSLRVNRRMKDVPMPMVVVGSGNFSKYSAQTLSNVLAAEPGIAMGRDGVWSTGINIRGLGENRLVTMIDGHRVETATDLTASFSMIDVNDIERVEVVKGAQSALYGTGAMGGIINIITRDGRFGARPYISGNVLSGYASANHLFTLHGDVTAGAPKVYLRLSGSRQSADDIRTPRGVLPNSGFTSSNISARAGWTPWNNHVVKVQYQNNWSEDVGIPGGSAFPGPATASYKDISRHLFSATYEITPLTGKLSSLKANYFTQYIQRDVEMIPHTVTETALPNKGKQITTPERVLPVGNHLMHGGQLQSTWDFGPRNTLIAGADLWSRGVRTSRIKEITVQVFSPAGELVRTNALVRGETPTPASSFTSTGLFIQDEARLFNDRLTLISGGRIDGVRVQNDQGQDIDYLIVNGVRNDTPPNQRITFPEGDHRNLSWSAHAGLLCRVTRETGFTLNLARSFRAPSIEELFKYIDLGNFVRLGNTALKPENGFSADGGVRIWKKDFNLQFNGFVNSISNLVVETPGEFIYNMNTGTGIVVTDTLPALVNANVSKALLYGADFGVEYNTWSHMVLFASGSYVRGKDTKAGSNLPQVPPLHGRMGVRYTLPRAGSAEMTLVGAARQDKIAEGEKETAGYTRLDIAVSSIPLRVGSARLQLFAGVDNLTDRSYTNHLATNRGSISAEPGRNLYLRLNLAF